MGKKLYEENGIKMARQGDLLILKVPVLPKGLIRQENNVLALGEATGHKHELRGKAVTYVSSADERSNWALPIERRLWAGEGTKYFIAEETVTLVHDEHGPIELTQGRYMVIRQREYDPERNRMVVD